VFGACGCMSEARSGLDLRRGACPPSRRAYKRKICWREPVMSDDVCFHLQTFCGSLAPAAGFPRDFFSLGSHWVAHVRTCACVSLSWYRHTLKHVATRLPPAGPLVVRAEMLRRRRNRCNDC
jgi:hypothetical protein